jgi:ATP-dependent helicase/nuclease subunit A
MLEAGALASVDVGEATHLVLQHLDFRRPCDRDDLTAQLAELVERKAIADTQAKAVDVGSLAWLMQSDIGKMLRDNVATVRREIPVYVADNGSQSEDPLDRVMRRGRIDVLIPSPDGPVLIDYKTDRISSKNVQAAAESYQSQLAAYRGAAAEIIGIPVRRAIFVFLHARAIVEIGGDADRVAIGG